MKLRMTILAAPVFDGAVIAEGDESIKGQGSAKPWAKKLAAETGSDVIAGKTGNGWALCGSVDGVNRDWGIYGKRLKRLN